MPATHPSTRQRLLRRSGPLSDSYPAAVALVLLALTPYLILTTALTPLQDALGHDLALSPRALQVTAGMSNAAYAFGAVLGVQLTARLPVRRVLLVTAATFVVASVLAAWAPTSGLWIAGRVAQGLTTGMMLIAAVPPLVIGWPVQKMPITGAVMNMGIFGAVALGPVIGGVVAGQQAWHGLFWVVAGIGALAVLFAVLTYEDQEPQDADAPVDLVAMVLAGGGCAAAFLGVSEVVDNQLMSSEVLIPGSVGVVLLLALLAYEYRHPNPLIPVERLLSTLPVAGIAVAMVGGAASVAIVALVEAALQQAGSPTHTAMLFWPEFGGAVVAAVIFGALFRTKWTPLVAFSGLVLLAAGAAVLTGVAGGDDALVLAGSAAVGLGVGASVSPALFLAGFSLPAPQLPRIFAMVELLRGVAAFLVAPLLLHLAQTTGGGQAAGIRTTMWVLFGLVCGGALLAAAIYLAGGQRLERPQLERWLGGEGSAKESHPLGAALVGRDGAG
ncbi:MAG TPA: MFS transporter [Baekduia sp.]|nr:MFS transporter [Baekduia sp.]